MFDPIFAATGAHTGVAPIMFGDELLVRPGRNILRFASRSHRKRFPLRTASPGIRHFYSKIDMFDFVFHWQREIVFAVKRACDERDGPARNEFANEDNAASPGVGRFLADVETQIQFFKIAMERDRESEQTRVEEKEANDAN